MSPQGRERLRWLLALGIGAGVVWFVLLSLPAVLR